MVPVTTILPLSMMETWSQTCSTSSMTWLKNSTGETEADEAGQQPADDIGGDRIDAFSGLSRNSTEGLWIRAQPSMAFLRMPVE